MTLDFSDPHQLADFIMTLQTDKEMSECFERNTRKRDDAFKKMVRDRSQEILDERNRKPEPTEFSNPDEKIYRRKINSSMARVLIIMYKYNSRHPGKFFHLIKYLTETEGSASGFGDFPKLRYWSLIEKSKDIKDDGNPDSGFYRITEEGIDFVLKRTTTDSHRLFCKGESKEDPNANQINIEQSLDKHFNYRELMQNYAD